jgi:DNA topoisomerase-1
MNILIVESPAKCSKIQGFLGAGWRVQATMGHFRGLKEGLDGIGFQTGWAPVYDTLKTKATAIASLKKLKGTIYLGSDDDREGEAIAWHVCQLLGLPVETTPRVIFHEITKEALTKAVAKPTRINMAVVEAQQARSMLDLLIGFTLSPCLWKGVGYKPGLSAGRCQTPALRIVYDRDLQIEAHQTKKTWTLSAVAVLKWVCPTAFEEEPNLAELAKDPILLITDRKDSVSSHKAPAPFITSSLQQEASSRLRMNPKTTMRVAQTLYEQGHITYMRTDSAVLSEEATLKARSLVETRWGQDYLQPMTAKGSDGPHEGIRPTHLETESIGEGDEARLYTLIWRRTMQSVMSDHKEAVVRLKGIIATTEFYTESRETTFTGWRMIGMPAAEDESEGEDPVSVSTLKAGKKLRWASMLAKETLTSPPPRYSEASLVRELEKKGIGRPSTYASLIETVLERGYVEKAKPTKEKVPIKSAEIVAGSALLRKTEYIEKSKGNGLQVTSLGRTVIEWLLSQFGHLVDYGFTAAMEGSLDDVANSTLDKKVLLEDIWTTYKDRYSEIMASGSGPRAGSESKGALGEGYKVIVTKKGPLFVLEKEGVAAQFASLPPTVSVKTATLADAKAAFADLSGTMLGSLEGKPVLQKKGKYGPYVTWTSPKGSNINLTYGSETFEEVCTKLRAKIASDSVDHQIGPFRIKKGPYGLYMFKVLKTAKKPLFVSIPADTSWSTLTVEGAEALYKASIKAK